MNVYEGIQQSVGQVIRAGPPNAAAVQPNTVSYGFEAVSRAFLERKHIVFSEEHGQLLAAARRVIHAHSGRDKKMVFIFIDLWPLVDIDDILKSKTVDFEKITQLTDEIEIAQTTDVDPDDGGAPPLRLDGSDALRTLLEQAVSTVMHQKYFRLKRRGIGD